MDEVFKLLPEIKKRTISDYLMQLSIASNPHSKQPKELWEMLENQIREPLDEKIDREGMNMLKQKMAGSQRIAIK